MPRCYPCASGLRRLLSAPAGRRTFPALSLRIFPHVPGPVPRLLPWCPCPFLPTGRRPSRCPEPVGAWQHPHPGNFGVDCSRGCSHSLMFRPAVLLATQVAPTAVRSSRTGQPWLFHPSISRFDTSPCPGYAIRPFRAIDGGRTFTSLDSQPCRLLPKRAVFPHLVLRTYSLPRSKTLAFTRALVES